MMTWAHSPPLPLKSPLYHLHLHFFLGHHQYVKIHWLQKRKRTLFMSHKTHNVHNNNIHDGLSHSFWKGIEDMKTPGIYLSLPSSNLTYYTHTHTWDRLIHILTKESKLKESSSYFSFLYLWGEGEGKEVSSPRLVPTPNFLLACWQLIYDLHYHALLYHPLRLPCGTTVVIIEMWTHWPPCGRLLRNVVMLEMWHFQQDLYPFFLYSHFFVLEFWVNKVYKKFMVFACHVTNMPSTFLLMLLYNFYSFISGFSSNFQGQFLSYNPRKDLLSQMSVGQESKELKRSFQQ